MVDFDEEELGRAYDYELAGTLGKFAGGFIPGISEAIDAHDMAEAIRKDDKTEMALIGAGAALPLVTPQMLRAVKGIPEAFAELPDSAFKRLTYELLQRGRTTVKDIRDMFDEAGDLVGFHGTKNKIEDFTTAQGDEFMGTNTDMWGGPGLYQGHMNLQSPIEIGSMDPVVDQGIAPLAVHQIITPREDISRLAGHNFMRSPEEFKGAVEFGDQSEQVKDSFATLFPKATDDRRQQLYDVSPYATSKPYRAAEHAGHTDKLGAPTLAGEAVEDIDVTMDYNHEWQGDFPAIRQQANDAGLAGNIHVEGGSPRLASVNFNPDRTHVEGVDLAKYKEWNAARGGSYEPAPVRKTFMEMDLTPDPGNPRIRRSPAALGDSKFWDNYEPMFLQPSFMRDDAIDAIAASGSKIDEAVAKDLRQVDWDEATNEYMPDDILDHMIHYNEPGNLEFAMKTRNKDRLEEIHATLQEEFEFPTDMEEAIMLIDEAIEIDPEAAEKLMDIHEIFRNQIPDF